jgi:ornithine carbamoyltransferase
VRGVDFIHTDVWLSMGESEEHWAQRIELLRDYQVNAALMEASGNARVRSCTACRPSTTWRPGRPRHP